MKKKQNLFSAILNLEDGVDAITKKECLIEAIFKTILAEAEKMNISFRNNASITEMLIGLNMIIREYNIRKIFNTEFLISILNAMSDIQEHSIEYITEKNSGLIENPLYVYDGKGNLISFKNHFRSDNLNALISLINYLENEFMLEKINRRTLK